MEAEKFIKPFSDRLAKLQADYLQLGDEDQKTITPLLADAKKELTRLELLVNEPILRLEGKEATEAFLKGQGLKTSLQRDFEKGAISDVTYTMILECGDALKKFANQITLAKTSGKELSLADIQEIQRFVTGTLATVQHNARKYLTDLLRTTLRLSKIF